MRQARAHLVGEVLCSAGIEDDRRWQVCGEEHARGHRLGLGQTVAAAVWGTIVGPPLRHHAAMGACAW